MSLQNLNDKTTSCSADDDEHLLKLDDLCKRLNTDCYYGLTCKHARSLLKKDGFNQYTRPSNLNGSSNSLFKNLFKSKSEQQWSKRDWNRVFNTDLDVQYIVIRDGQKAYVKRREIVRGDLICLHEGHIVPADMRVITYQGELLVDNRIITGNQAELKSNSPTSTDSLLTQNIIFASTVILQGSCEAIVIKKGDETVFAELTQFATKVKLTRPHSNSVSSTYSDSTFSLGGMSLPSSLPSTFSLASENSSLSEGVSTMSL